MHFCFHTKPKNACSHTSHLCLTRKFPTTRSKFCDTDRRMTRRQNWHGCMCSLLAKHHWFRNVNHCSKISKKTYWNEKWNIFLYDRGFQNSIDTSYTNWDLNHTFDLCLTTYSASLNFTICPLFFQSTCFQKFLQPCKGLLSNQPRLCSSVYQSKSSMCCHPTKRTHLENFWHGNQSSLGFFRTWCDMYKTRSAGQTGTHIFPPAEDLLLDAPSIVIRWIGVLLGPVSHHSAFRTSGAKLEAFDVHFASLVELQATSVASSSKGNFATRVSLSASASCSPSSSKIWSMSPSIMYT